MHPVNILRGNWSGNSLLSMGNSTNLSIVFGGCSFLYLLSFIAVFYFGGERWGLQLSSMQKGCAATLNIVRVGHRVPPKTKFSSNLQQKTHFALFSLMVMGYHQKNSGLQR